MTHTQQLELFERNKFQDCIETVLKTFPGSRVLTPKEAQSISLRIRNNQNIQVQDTHKKPAKPGLGREAAGFGRQQQGYGMNEIFDQVCSRGGE